MKGEGAGVDHAADARIHALLKEYAHLTDALYDQVDEGLWCLTLADTDRARFGGRASILLATSADALERHPDAEIAVHGSAFVEQLIQGVRAHGHRSFRGALPAVAADTTTELASQTGGVHATLTSRETAAHRVGRLVARVTLGAGASVSEHIVDSDLIDLETGAVIPADVAMACDACSAQGTAPTPVRTVLDETLLSRFLAGIEARVRGASAALASDALRALGQELQRIDAYYDALVQQANSETGARSVAVDAIERDRARRRIEEQRRHEVRAEVHPLQLIEWDVPVERAMWQLRTAAGRSADVLATRWLAASPAWRVNCPLCGSAAAAINVCRSGHAVCGACAATCSVCRERFCAEHGFVACHIDGLPVCSEHGQPCAVCESAFCTAHAGRCAIDAHPVCASCVATCAGCGRDVCGAHGLFTAADAPLGSRWLCNACVVHCEGGTREPVGRDEATTCATCIRWICRAHQVTCAVDERVHCSTHLRPSDRSGRLICETHRAACVREPGSILAQDEVRPCVQCGAAVCERHGAACIADGQWHCDTHAAPLADRPDAFACVEHRVHCHVDGRAYTPAGVESCSACGHPSCAQHVHACDWCGDRVCQNEWRDADRRCTTCAALSASLDIPDAILAAAVRYLGPQRAKGWRAARDAQRTVAEADLGWTRRLVVSVPHGAAEATSAMRHSLLGSWALPFRNIRKRDD